jgi:neutral ceramidase
MRRAAWCIGILAALYLLLLVDWRSTPQPAQPVLRRAFNASAPLQAGAASVRLSPPLPVVRAGYGFPWPNAVRERDPLEVRALVLRSADKTLALVLIDLVLVPDELTEALEARLADLRLDGVVLAATHSHSSVGAFDRRVLAQVVGTGRYRADVVECLLSRADRAVREALGQVADVRLRTAETRLTGWAENRSSPGEAVDDRLTVGVFERADGANVATLAIVAAHPTLLARTTPELSADYPGVVMRRLEAAGGVAFLFQGAEGDARPRGRGEQAIADAGAFVADHVVEAARQAQPSRDGLAFADVAIGLPPAEPQALRAFLLRRPAANVLQLVAPRRSRVTAVVIGDVYLLGVPGEPTARAAQEMLAGMAALGDRKTRVVGLMQGYVGYMETRDRMRDGRGESRRAWFTPELLGTVIQGLRVAVTSAGVASSYGHPPGN